MNRRNKIIKFRAEGIDMQMREAQRVPNKMETKRPILRHIVIKMPSIKDKERILKAVRKKQLVTYMEFP